MISLSEGVPSEHHSKCNKIITFSNKYINIKNFLMKKFYK